MLRRDVEPQWWLLNEETAADVLDTLQGIRAVAARHIEMPVLLRMIERNSAAVLIIEAQDRENIGAIGLVGKQKADGAAMLSCDLEVRAPIDPVMAEVLALKLEQTAKIDTGFGLCSTIHISADGPFPCPRGFDFEDCGNNFRTMARQVGAAQIN